MDSVINHYLLVFDHARDELIETVKITHSTYFARSAGSDLRGLLRLDELAAQRG